MRFWFVAGLSLFAFSVALPPDSRAGDADVVRPTTVFSGPEKYENHPAGALTSRKQVNADSFSQSSANIKFERELDFKVGNGFFRRLWVSAPASTRASDGLGPLYNARSCQRCHLKDGRGHPPAANFPDDNAISMLMRLSIPPQNENQRAALASGRADAIPDPVYGGQLQDFAIQGHKAEGRIHIAYTEVPVSLAGGETVMLRKPVYSITDPGYGAPHPDLMMSPRVAPQMIGLGLLEAIPANDIVALAGNTDQHDGVEASQKVLDLVAYYSRNLAVPARRRLDAPEVLAGKRQFYKTGCISCHRPKFITARNPPGLPEQSRQLIWPYSDMLLHDMGAGLADNRPEARADGREWRTPPLWGIGLTETVSGHTNFLHDGRARNLTEAILWHGGEAEKSKERFRNLTAAQRHDLIKFLESL